MPDWRISTTGADPTLAHRLAAATYPPLTQPSFRRTFLLTGDDQPRIAACAHAALQTGHRLVLLPTTAFSDAHPSGTRLTIGQQHVRATPATGTTTRDGWDVALFTSGSSTGTSHGYGFTTAQLDIVTAWYQSIYGVSADSVILTALPATYNFPFIAGVLLAARLGAHLHLSRSSRDVLHDAAQLARSADRLIVLANPVTLDHATLCTSLPSNITIDSGGAPLTTTAITHYRNYGLDLREGYGLTETASLTHFDTEATHSSLGTVGAALPGVCTTLTTDTGIPIIEITSPATGVPLDPSTPLLGKTLRTTDLGRIDDHGRLRLLGRTDDAQIAGLWPRDTLDILGPLLGRRCSLVRHPTPDRAVVQLLAPLAVDTTVALRDRAADALGLSPPHITIIHQGGSPLLHSVKITRRVDPDGRVPR